MVGKMEYLLQRALSACMTRRLSRGSEGKTDTLLAWCVCVGKVMMAELFRGCLLVCLSSHVVAQNAFHLLQQ